LYRCGGRAHRHRNILPPPLAERNSRCPLRPGAASDRKGSDRL